ncbi:DUF6492 family protein [Phaeospirillum tilakii]|uniref:DUF6492 family protein n=1 Tax=Phaeospirillum tilakii TaxID=741673 RepID=A0ABW5CAF5_9PROT
MSRLGAILPVKTRGRHYADNIARCDILFSSLRAFTPPATFDRFLVVVPHDEMAAAREYVRAWSDFPIELVDESEPMAVFAEFNQPHQIRPWHRQQIIKLNAPALLDTDFIMVFDPDVFAVQPFTRDDLILDGRALTYPQPRMREPHLWRPSAGLLEQEPHLDRDGIWWTPAILARPLLLDLQCRLEELYHQDWKRVLLSHYMIDWTEYTLYWLNAERAGLIERYHTLPPPGRRALHVEDSVWYAGKGGRNLEQWDAPRHFGPDGAGLFAVVQSNTHLPPARVVDKLTPYLPIRLQPYRRDTDPLRRAVEIYAALARRGLGLLRRISG